jgi:hypothetical protein
MILRHQLNVLQRKSSKRPTFGMLDRLIFAGLYRMAPKLLSALAIVKPVTVIKWRRASRGALARVGLALRSHPQHQASIGLCIVFKSSLNA